MTTGIQDTFHFFGVYDGHGGIHAAEFCRDHMHENIREAWCTNVTQNNLLHSQVKM